jgi:hypothetical protein
LQPLCRTFTVLAGALAEIVAEFKEMEVKRWRALKRLQKKLAFLPPLFHALFAGFIMSINKRATRFSPLLKS